MHLPHYAVTTDDAKSVRVLARQPIDMSRPHPFVQAGNREFNTFLWMPPSGDRAGDVLFADSTVFNTLFGGDESLERFWRNLATSMTAGDERPTGWSWTTFRAACCGPAPPRTRRRTSGCASRTRPPAGN